MANGFTGITTTYFGQDIFPPINETNPGWTYADGEPTDGFWGGLIDVILITCLSSLTGIRAMIPLFTVAIGHKFLGEHTTGLCFSEDPESFWCPHWKFPLKLDADYQWLERPKVLMLLAFLIVMEMVADCIPALAEAVDGIMVVLKPLISVFMANGVDFPTYAGQTAAIAAAAMTSAPAAMAKMSNDVAVDGVTLGSCTVCRSLSEDALVITLTPLTILAPITVLILLMCWCSCCLYCFWAIIRARLGKMGNLLDRFKAVGTSKSDLKIELLDLDFRVKLVEEALHLESPESFRDKSGKAGRWASYTPKKHASFMY
mmetsp:Transcript_53588/g.98281  ORF Transcript_53588/g.98281 Transcript_53588/m.98281 type:complete len:316 (-) Transcript_53588:73-1020(-)